MSTFQRLLYPIATFLDLKAESEEKFLVIAKWLNNVFYTFRNAGIRISFCLNPSSFNEEGGILMQDYIMLIRVPFQKIPSAIEIDNEDCWDRFSTNVLRAILRKLRRYYLYTDSANIPPCRENIIVNLEREIERRETEEIKIKEVIQKGRKRRY